MQARLQSFLAPLLDQLLPLAQKIIQQIISVRMEKRIRTHHMIFPGYRQGNVNFLVCRLFDIWICKEKADKSPLSLYCQQRGSRDEILLLSHTSVDLEEKENVILQDFLHGLSSLLDSFKENWNLLKKVEDFNQRYSGATMDSRWSPILKGIQTTMATGKTVFFRKEHYPEDDNEKCFWTLLLNPLAFGSFKDPMISVGWIPYGSVLILKD